jgi:hypothetical protein
LPPGSLIMVRWLIRRDWSQAVTGYLRQPAFWLVVYFLLSGLAYTPLRADPAAVLPTGRVSLGVVSLFNAWTIWWNADQLREGLRHYWDAPIFWPEKGAFAFSEPQPLTLLVAPIVWLAGPVVAYHAYFLLSVTLNGYFAFRLAKSLGARCWSAALAGVLVCWLPLIYLQPELLQFVPLWPVMWSWEAIIRLWSWRNTRHAAGLAAAVVLSFAASLYLGLFNLLVLLPSLAALGVVTRNWAALGACAAALLVAAVVLLPLIVPVGVILSQQQWERSRAVVEAGSATGDNWLLVPHPGWGRMLLEGAIARERPLNPGLLRICVAVGGSLLVLCRRHTCTLSRRGVALLGSLALTALVGSLGPRLRIFGLCPWEFLGEFFPPVRWVRSPYRFAYLAQAALLVLVGAGFQACILAVGKLNGLAPKVEKLPRTVVLVPAIVLALLLCAEVLPAAAYLVPAPDYSRPPGWVKFLREHRQDARAFLLLDFPSGASVLEFESTVRAMLWQPVHGLPMMNGYSGFFPSSWLRRLHSWREQPCSPEAIAELRRLGVRYLIRPAGSLQDPACLGESGAAKLVFADRSGTQIWQLGE